jgi:hypothetical protein
MTLPPNHRKIIDLDQLFPMAPLAHGDRRLWKENAQPMFSTSVINLGI